MDHAIAVYLDCWSFSFRLGGEVGSASAGATGVGLGGHVVDECLLQQSGAQSFMIPYPTGRGDKIAGEVWFAMRSEGGRYQRGVITKNSQAYD